MDVSTIIDGDDHLRVDGSAFHRKSVSLDLNSLYASLDDALERVHGITMLPKRIVFILLSHHGWDEERLMESFADRLDVLRVELAPLVGPMECWTPEARGTMRSTGHCPSCLEENVSGLMLPCGHLFCYECWELYLEMCTMERQVSAFTCPARNCGLLFGPELVEAIASERALARYRRKLANHYVKSHPLIRWCPGDSCEMAIMVFRESSCGGSCVCTSCQHTFCFWCGHEDHHPCSCEMLSRWADVCHEEGQTEEYMSRFTRGCPECHVRIEKTGGCNKMDCTRCGHSFCWVCSQPWSSHSFFYTCNRYRVEKLQHAAEQLRKRLGGRPDPSASVQARAGREAHCYERYQAHHRTETVYDWIRARAHSKCTQSRDELISRGACASQVVQLEESVERSLGLLLCARRALKYSYVLSCFLPRAIPRKLYEFLQEDLETSTEHLAHLLEAQGDGGPLSREQLQHAQHRLHHRAHALFSFVHDRWGPPRPAAEQQGRPLPSAPSTAAPSRDARRGNVAHVRADADALGFQTAQPEATRPRRTRGNNAYTLHELMMKSSAQSVDETSRSGCGVEDWPNEQEEAMLPSEDNTGAIEIGSSMLLRERAYQYDEDDEDGYDDGEDGLDDEDEESCLRPIQVLRRKTTRGQRVYLVKYQRGRDEESPAVLRWEPFEEISRPSLVMEYEQSRVKNGNGQGGGASARGDARPRIRGEGESKARKGRRPRSAAEDIAPPSALMGFVHHEQVDGSAERATAFMAQYWRCTGAHRGNVVCRHSTGEDDATRMQRTRETMLHGIQGATLACGEAHAVVVDREGKAYSFGCNESGECGQRCVGCAWASVGLMCGPDWGVRRAVGASCGAHHTAILDHEGAVWTCGAGDQHQLGRAPSPPAVESGPHASQLVRVVRGLEGLVVDKVACGSYHTVAACVSGVVVAWGRNEAGQLGVGPSIQGDCPAPARVKGLPTLMTEGGGVVALDAGENHTILCIGPHGHVYACGGNEYGQLGIGLSRMCPRHGGEGALCNEWTCTDVRISTQGSVDTFTRVARLAHVSRVACGRGHSAAVVANAGELFAWGRSPALGSGEAHHSPTLVEARHHHHDEGRDGRRGAPDVVVRVVAHGDGLAAIDQCGRVHAWGSDAERMLNTVDDEANASSPWMDVCVGGTHALLIAPSAPSNMRTTMARARSEWDSLCDCSFIIVGVGQEREAEFRAHRCVLCIRSLYFEELFRRRESSGDTCHMGIPVRRVSAAHFSCVLEYLYADALPSREIARSKELQRLARTFRLPRLSRYCRMCAQAVASIMEEGRGQAGVPPSTFQRDWSIGLERSLHTDVSFALGDGVERVGAHRIVLAAHCPYYASLFSCGMKDSSSRTLSIPLGNKDAFSSLLTFLYTGGFSTATTDVDGMLVVLQLADMLGCVEAKEAAERNLVLCVDVSSVARVYVHAQSLDARMVERYCLEAMLQWWTKVQTAQAWRMASAHTQASLRTIHRKWHKWRQAIASSKSRRERNLGGRSVEWRRVPRSS